MKAYHLFLSLFLIMCCPGRAQSVITKECVSASGYRVATEIEYTADTVAAADNSAGIIVLPEYEGYGGICGFFAARADEVFGERPKAGSYTVNLEFKIRNDGSTYNVLPVEETTDPVVWHFVKAIRNMKGKWLPGIENGRTIPFKCRLTLKITIAG